MKIVRGMQKPFRCDDKELSALGWKNSFSQGIGITAPKRGSGSSSNQSRAGPSSSAARPDTQGTSILQAVSTVKDGDVGEVQEQVVVDEFLENSGGHDNKVLKSDELFDGKHKW
ncbi:hypothetical protein OIU85_028480 [Salix viminalis]|uniref:Uncharacterized protein n=1 Tax=Salix viminalis TaxID=40686 RepID=A0A9Q0QKK2_SALVM|nr:hypothetical protein OIU85_028480 [Salix viminalis]